MAARAQAEAIHVAFDSVQLQLGVVGCGGGLRLGLGDQLLTETRVSLLGLHVSADSQMTKGRNSISLA